MSYNAIVERVLGTIIGTPNSYDWLRRPLSPEQIQYALEDVSHVLHVWERQKAWLEARGRFDWATAEFDHMCQDIYDEEQSPPWENSGIHKVPRRDLLVAQRLAQWREEEAAYRNKPTRASFAMTY